MPQNRLLLGDPGLGISLGKIVDFRAYSERQKWEHFLHTANMNNLLVWYPENLKKESFMKKFFTKLAGWLTLKCLKGKRTYIIAIATAIVAILDVIQVFGVKIPSEVYMILASLGGVSLRAGVKKSQKEAEGLAKTVKAFHRKKK